MALLEMLLLERPLHQRDPYLQFCLVYARIVLKCRVPLAKYKEAVGTMGPPKLSDRAKEARQEIFRRLVRSGTLLLPTDLYDIYTARSCLAEGYPVMMGQIDKEHLTEAQAELLARLDFTVIASLLNPEGLNFSSSMRPGDIFHSFIPNCFRVDMSFLPGHGARWTCGIPADEWQEMEGLATLIAMAEFDRVMPMGKPARVCLVDALCAEHGEEVPKAVYETAGNRHVFGNNETIFDPVDHPQMMLAQCVGINKARGEARLADAVIANVIGRPLGEGKGCLPWVEAMPHVPGRKELVEELIGTRTTEIQTYKLYIEGRGGRERGGGRELGMTPWLETSLYVQLWWAPFSVYSLEDFLAKNWEPPAGSTAQLPNSPTSAVVIDLATKGGT
jgi:hypothetical protein